jgi:signal transduction histidine kinase
VNAGTRAPALGVVREGGLGFIAGLAAFAVVAVAVAAIDSGLAVAVLGAALVAAIVVIFRQWGYAFGVPVAIAGMLAYDWFQFPPTHPKAFPGVADLADLIVYIGIGVVTGVALADARRRTADTERARHELADEQAALRRVATLVAREAPSADVFAVVTKEVARILDVDDARMFRYDAGASATVVAAWGRSGADLGVGKVITLDGDSVTARIQRSGRAARIDAYEPGTGSLNAAVREWGIRSAVGAPIVVEGKLWGAIAAASRKREPLPRGTESRMEEFTKLVAAAVANIEARTELAASRARLVAAADDERRRVVRDLHDGAQQRLVHTIVTLKMARTALDRGDVASTALVTEALGQAQAAIVELRELANGILPSVLSWGGLSAGVEALASRMPMPVEVNVSLGRLAPAVEASAYFVVAEALTNVVKHAHASRAAVTAIIENGALQISVEDDGVGMADANGTGLLGLRDRLSSVDGSLRVRSAPAEGTALIATVPLPPEAVSSREGT